MSRAHDRDMLDLVAVFALGGINATTGECAEVRAHLAECPQCREEYEVASAAAAAVGLSAAQAPSQALRGRILSALPSTPARPVSSLPQRRRPPWVIPAAVAAAIVLAGSLWWNVHRAPPERWAAACAAGAADCHASGTVTAVGGVLQVRLQGLAALPAGKQYQAWVIPPGGKPKPEPVFGADQGGRAALDIPEAAVKGSIVAFTVEPAGGSRAPTTKPFLLAALD